MRQYQTYDQDTGSDNSKKELKVFSVFHVLIDLCHHHALAFIDKGGLDGRDFHEESRTDKELIRGFASQVVFQVLEHDFLTVESHKVIDAETCSANGIVSYVRTDVVGVDVFPERLEVGDRVEVVVNHEI